MNEVTRRLSSGAPSFPTADRLDVGHFASSIPFLPRSERSEWSTGERSEPDMEEEIIGNRWKELDYDGYCPALVIPFATLIPFLTGRRRRMKGGDKGRGVPHSLRPFVTRTRGLVGPRSARSSSSLPSAPNGLPPDRSAGYGVSKESDSKERTDMNVMSRG